MAENLIASRFQPVPGPFEPWYCTITDPATNYVKMAWYECPFCQRKFFTRKMCEQHCKGRPGMHQPTCPVLK